MIFGKKQTLVMIKRVEFGIYLAETMKDAENKVLLPKKQVPADMEVGDPIDVFLYKDSNDRPIATVKEPKLTLGQTARLRVVSVGKVGAFLDWGLEKDLFLPYREQTTQVKAGDEVIAALYLDGGMEVARNFILPFITEGKHAEADYKTRLQEIVQQNPEERLSYVVESESGPDHDKHFVVAVRFNSDRVARGEGRSKKAAEQHAAKEALKLLGVIKEK